MWHVVAMSLQAVLSETVPQSPLDMTLTLTKIWASYPVAVPLFGFV